jgi:ATP-dependent DNA helicase RecQ
MKVNIAEVKQKMQDVFGFSSFREGQQEIIQDLLQREDVLGILPTGTGKSMCYQLPSLFLDGLTLVVSPLISLMVDQVKQLRAKGFKRVTALNSIVDSKQKDTIIRNLHQFKLVYCSPEMLQNEKVIARLKSIKVSLFVVDEAHCISQWGHEFRTDYLKLQHVIAKLQNPTVLALSATATAEVQEDIMNKLNRPDMKKRVYPMDRENIAFVIEATSNWFAKVERIIEVLKTRRVPTMIYFSSRLWCEKVSQLLQAELPNYRISYYHGGMEKDDRLLIQQQFMNNQLDVICCTSAFGMGVDKQDVRLVIHYQLPTQIESYIQEVGRAGRDGKQSVGLILYCNGDEQLPYRLIEQELPSEQQINYVFRSLLQQEHTPLSQFEDELVEMEQLNETQWNFLKHQLEVHGILRENNIVNIVEWDQALKKTLAMQKKRQFEKYSKVHQLLDWVQSDECRRKSIYQSFQSGYKKPLLYCCDRCGPVIENWNPIPTEVYSERFNWEKQLEDIFHQGG